MRTPSQHRDLAEQDLARRTTAPGTPAYTALTQSAIAHVLAAIAYYLEPPPAPEIPGLPPGWKLETRQSTDGDRLWGYILTSPAGIPDISRYRWGSSDTALTAGLSAARAAIGHQEEPR